MISEYFSFVVKIDYGFQLLLNLISQYRISAYYIVISVGEQLRNYRQISARSRCIIDRDSYCGGCTIDEISMRTNVGIKASMCYEC